MAWLQVLQTFVMDRPVAFCGLSLVLVFTRIPDTSPFTRCSLLDLPGLICVGCSTCVNESLEYMHSGDQNQRNSVIPQLSHRAWRKRERTNNINPSLSPLQPSSVGKTAAPPRACYHSLPLFPQAITAWEIATFTVQLDHRQA